MGRGGRYTHCGGDPCVTDTWEDMYGTTMEGNLPQYKKSQHIGNIWMPCPYSTQAVLDFSRWPEFYGTTIQEYEATYGPVDRYSRIRTMLGLAPTDPLPTLADHTMTLSTGISKEVYLRPARKGVWGYECIFPGCPHLTNTGKRYFYI